MSKVFEVGKKYFREERGFDPIMVVKRTAKTITCYNYNPVWDYSKSTYRHRIHVDDDGTEYIYDPYVPLRHRDGTVCNASWEVKE